MSSAILNLAFRETKNQNHQELFLLEELDKQSILEREQKIKQSQIEITATTNYDLRITRQRKHGRTHYWKNKQTRIATSTAWIKEKRKCEKYKNYFRKFAKKTYQNMKEKKILALGIDGLREEWRLKKRKFELRLTKEQKAERYQKRKAREIEQCGGIEAWRERNRLTTQNYRAKKKQEKK